MRRFQINNMSDSYVFLTYDEVVEFGAYLRAGQRTTCDNIYSELIEQVVFRYTDSEIAIFIQYGIEPTDDPVIVDIYNVKDNALLFSGDHLDESVLPESTEEYVFQESIEVVAEVINFPLPEGMEGTDKYVVAPEVRSDADRLRDLAENADGTIGKRVALTGIPCDIDTKELLTFTLEKDDIFLFKNENPENDLTIHCGIMIDQDYCELMTSSKREKILVNSRMRAKYCYMIKQHRTEKLFFNKDFAEYDEDYYEQILDSYIDELECNIRIMDDDDDF